jgi:hypothetical protein
MYKSTPQLSIDDFIFPYGKLKANNRWVCMADLVPWDEIERNYAAGFVNNGAPAHPARMALGSLIIKQMLGCSDEELCSQVAENPYMQFFCGLKEFSDECPFGASTLVAFRKRFSEEDIKRINECMLTKAKDDDDGNSDNGGSSGGSANVTEHTMALDATVAPSDITYPQDVKLINSAREYLEGIIDSICEQSGAAKPRMYRKCARWDFLNWSKAKRRTTKKTRAAIRRQLAYVARDLRYVAELIDEVNPDLTKRQIGLLGTIEVLYAQQKQMYDTKTHSIPNRIVSIPQPWVRPIVRGKANANTEFGAKVNVSTDDLGLARIENLSFDAYNESECLIDAIEAYHDREGFYPDRILADQIYRSRANIAWCKERGIRLSGPALGRPPKDSELTRALKAQQNRDAADRNVIEGVFGTAKKAYGLDKVAARLEQTTRTVISLSILVFNLKKLLAASSSQFLGVIILAIEARLRTLIARWPMKSLENQLVME